MLHAVGYFACWELPGEEERGLVWVSQVYVLAPYLSALIKFKNRRVVSRFRCGNLLPISWDQALPCPLCSLCMTTGSLPSFCMNVLHSGLLLEDVVGVPQH